MVFEKDWRSMYLGTIQVALDAIKWLPSLIRDTASKEHLPLCECMCCCYEALKIESENYPTVVLRQKPQGPLITRCAVASFMPLLVALRFLKSLGELARSIS